MDSFTILFREKNLLVTEQEDNSFIVTDNGAYLFNAIAYGNDAKFEKRFAWLSDDRIDLGLLDQIGELIEKHYHKKFRT